MVSTYTARVAAVVLAICLLLSLAGCKSSDRVAEGAADGGTKAAQTAAVAPGAETKTVPKASAETPKAKTTTRQTTVTAKKINAKASSKKTSVTTKKTTTKSTKKAAPAARTSGSLTARVIDLTSFSVRDIFGNSYSFGPGGIQYRSSKDALISAQVRLRNEPGKGLQLYLGVTNNTGRTIRLNGYSGFTIRDLLGNEYLSTDIRLNQPIVMKDKEEQWLSVQLPKNWYDVDELRQLTLETGIFHSTIAFDYDFLD